MTQSIPSMAEKRYLDKKSSTFPDPTLAPDSDQEHLSQSTIQTILSHKSTRTFKPTPLPPGTIETLLTAAQSSSTSSLLQTYSIVAIQSTQTKAELSKLAGNQAFINTAPLFLLFVPNLHRLNTLSKIHQQHQQPQAQAPALEMTDMFIMSLLDAGLAGQNVSLAAEALGLGVCFVGAVRNNAQAIVELLQLPKLTWPAFGIAVGYPDLGAACEMSGGSVARVKPRLPMREVLHFEVWGGQREGEDEGKEEEVRVKENVEAYDGVLGRFYEEVGKGGRGGWGKFVAGMMARRELDGRGRIRGVLEGQGFVFG